MTVFLAGAECPFGCLHCDLARFTLAGPTPPGALPEQLRLALGEVAAELPPARWPDARLKLYNASNFFEERAVPVVDEPALAALASGFGRVVVECHPRLVGRRCLAFAERLGGRLEVAMGLETVHPEAFRRLGKGMRLEDFAAAATMLLREGIPSRAFVLLGPPFVPAAEAVDWAVRSVGHAFALGVERAVIIPQRSAEGLLAELVRQGDLVVPALAQLEAALEACLGGAGVAEADLWDAERLAACVHCRQARLARLGQMNRTGSAPPRLACPACTAEPGP